MCYSADRQEALALHLQACSDVYGSSDRCVYYAAGKPQAAALGMVKICRRQL
jgi:hypothetical protein